MKFLSPPQPGGFGEEIKITRIASILLLGLVLVSCLGCVPTPTPTPTLTSTATLTATPSAVLTEAMCVRVIDGDTIEVLIDDGTYRVRYIGMDTPEMNDPSPDIRALAEEATVVNTNLVEGKIVELEKDVSETDQYGRLLRYVYVGDTFVNAELVAGGYAWAKTYPPDILYEDLFLQLQAQAQEAGLGLWQD